ncbi:MAG: hypothetical protein H6835_19865 [Planctomycetes bacterium]|nr:hypothetical protein [Planctomycetota bacterium]
MMLRGDSVARLGAAAAVAAMLLSCGFLRDGAAEARARLERERGQLAALARLQSSVDGERRADLGQLSELRGLFGDAEVRWTRRGDCVFLTFGRSQPEDGAGVLAAGVRR